MSAQVSRLLWTIVLVVVAVVVVLGAVFGPELIRRGRAVAGPIVEMSRIDEEGAEIDREFPFTEPADGVVDGKRLEAFLSIREQLVPHYEGWRDVVRKVDREGESWDGAAEILGVTRDVLRKQNELLRSQGMGLAEFRWLERTVYDDWLVAVERGGGGEAPQVTRRVLELTREDLAVLDELTALHGDSRVARELRQRLEAREAVLDGARRVSVEGVPEATQELLWKHHDRIASLRMDEHMELHGRLRSENHELRVEMGGSEGGQ